MYVQGTEFFNDAFGEKKVKYIQKERWRSAQKTIRFKRIILGPESVNSSERCYFRKIYCLFYNLKQRIYRQFVTHYIVL